MQNHLRILLTSVLDDAVPSPIGQQLFETAGTFNFIVPDNCFFIHGVCVAAGGYGGGSRGTTTTSGLRGSGGPGLSWRNDIPVTPGETLKVIVGAASTAATVKGGNTYLVRQNGSTEEILLIAMAGEIGTNVATSGAGGLGGKNAHPINGGGGNGGSGGSGGSPSINAGGGGGSGGCGGYPGNGGPGGSGGSGSAVSGAPRGAATSGSGGGAGGAGGSGGGGGNNSASTGGNGAGTHLYGQYGDGNATVPNGSTPPFTSTAYGIPRQPGAMRLLWGDDRSFPTNNVIDL